MKTLIQISPIFEKLGYCMIAMACGIGLLFAAAPVTIQPTDILANSRATLNSNFLGLYNGSSGLVDCSGVAGRFVLTLNGGGTLPVCGTLTWSNITALSGFPGVVTTWNGRANAVTLTAADVAGVEQDLRISASPTFAGGTFNGSVSITGALSGITTGVTASNSGGYAYLASQSTAGGYTYTGSGNIYGGSTTGHQLMAASTADGSCTMRGDTGLSCSGTQPVLATSSPTFAAVTHTPTVVGSLPTCNSGEQGTIAYVTDATATTWGTTVVGGSSNPVGVSCNGTAWTIFSK